MSYQAVFKRYELKYLLTLEQKEILLAALEPYMALDAYGRDTIRNIYYDTDSYRLVRHSIERPAYKEKLRVRSYGATGSDRPVYVELKKKYDSIVYKRRLSLPEEDVLNWLSGRIKCPVQNQISREVDYFLSYYKTLHPAVFLTYEREAYYEKNGGDFRVTFDDHIFCRQENISLKSEPGGAPLLPQGMILMEIKCSGGIPLWMTRVLSSEHIYKTSYSKYGTAYQELILPQQSGFGASFSENENTSHENTSLRTKGALHYA